MSQLRIAEFGLQIGKASHRRDTEFTEVDRRTEGVGSVHPVDNPKPDIRNPQLLEAARQFEAFFVLQIWRAMKSTVPNQTQSVNHIDLFDLPFAEHLSQGGHFQIGSLIYEQMSRYTPQGGNDEND